jgi:hypothetical protein
VSPLPSATAAGDGNGRANGYWTGGDVPRGGASARLRRVVRRVIQAHKRSNNRGDVTGRVEDGDEERCSVSGDYADLGILLYTYILRSMRSAQ